MFKKILSLFCFIAINAENINMTAALHAEVASRGNPRVTKETYPILYSLIEGLASNAGIKMPRNINVYTCEGTYTQKNGVGYKIVLDIDSSVDLIGDISICQELIMGLTYEELEGLLAVNIAKIANEDGGVIAVSAITTFGATLAALYALNKYYDLELGSKFLEEVSYNSRYRCHHDNESLVKGVCALLVLPAAIVAQIVSNNLQKNADIKATEISNADNVIDGISALHKFKKSYFRDTLGSRLSSALKLKKAFRLIFYPVRSFTAKERIGYLKKSVGENRVFA